MSVKSSFIKNLKDISWYWIILAGMISLSIIFESIYYNSNYNENDVSRIQKLIAGKEQQMNQGIENLQSVIMNCSDSSDLLSDIPESIYETYRNEGLAYYYYTDSILTFWSDNIIPLPVHLSEITEQKMVRYGNSVFISSKKDFEKGSIYGLIHLKSEHPYANKMLENGFRKEYKLENEVNINLEENSFSDIHDNEGNFLFSLDFTSTTKILNWFKYLSIILYIAAFFVLLLISRRIIHNSGKGIKNLTIIISSLSLLILYYLGDHFQFPRIIFGLDIFTDLCIQTSYFSPTIGKVFILSVVSFYILYSFHIDFDLPELRKNNKLTKISLFLVFIIGSIFLYFLNIIAFRYLVLNTDISFETYKVLDISVYTFIAFIIIALYYAGFSIWTDKALSFFQNTANKQLAKWYILILISSLFIFCLFPECTIFNIESTLFFALTCFIIYYFRFMKSSGYRLSNFIVYVFIFSILTVLEVTRYSNEKNVSEMKMMAVSLSSEHDPVAELLFVDLEKKIQDDEDIVDQLYGGNFDIDRLYSTVERKYFSGFWDKYDLQITVCGSSDSVHILQPVDEWHPCYAFFYENILSEGSLVPNTNVYFLDNLNSRISYFLAIPFNPENEKEVIVFIELDSRLVLEGLGYPSLLLDESLQPNTNKYSYAKYSKNQLISSFGDFDYSTNSTVYTHSKQGFKLLKYDKYDHVIYHLDEENTIIVSKPSIFWIDIIISFSYIFGFFFILLLILLLISRISPVSVSLRPNFKTRIQMTMNSVLLFSFILIGIGTVYFSISQYRTKQYEILEEKVQSVYVELIHKLEYEENLYDWSSDSYSNLDELLQKFSNVFYTDINLYDAYGILLATSRPEIFNMGLLSDRMNGNAYKEMSLNKRSEYVQKETIGKMEYLSVYVPFVNSENHLLAYLNLPYFTKQDSLTREITNLVVAIINITVLLSLLGFTIAVFMANTITQPISLIQQKLGRLSLSVKNEFIEYKRNDEIGNLVREYNLMINQLQESAELLAKSERESAWREMAKQIAHEIKNPLTPMKLNIQHLQRSIKENPESAEELIEKISENLIEQIDTLSSIATEFSNFAKMPQAKNEVIDLEQKLKKSIELFTDYGNCILSLKVEAKEKLFVFVDKEQISRVFINLIQNAIQAIPENTTGKIEVRLSKINNMALISIRDNGKGIPEDVRGKLFMPNFTTKTSGMGLGLAIVRNIIHNAGGEIYFKTELGQGSTFYVELPLIDKDTKE